MTDESEFDAHFEYIVQYVEAHPYLSWIGVRPLDIERGRMRLTVPYSEKLVNPDQVGGNGVIHGGILATVLDHVSGMSLGQLLTIPQL